MTDTERFGMRVLTKSLDGWEDAWLVELEEAIRPVLKSYKMLDSGILRIDDLSMPLVRHVVVEHRSVNENVNETVVYPAFASGQPRYVDTRPVPIAGGSACTHVDALHDLAAGYVGLECEIEGERCPFALGQNRVFSNV